MIAEEEEEEKEEEGKVLLVVVNACKQMVNRTISTFVEKG